MGRAGIAGVIAVAVAIAGSFAGVIAVRSGQMTGLLAGKDVLHRRAAIDGQQRRHDDESDPQPQETARRHLSGHLFDRTAPS